MAVTGRKVSDFRGSFSKGSEEDFDHSCEPCLAIGQHTEAHGFCVDCEEYLCKTCFAYHQRTKASKYHQLLDKDIMDKCTIQNEITESAVCTEKCHIHKNEIIKFFCTNHEFLGCNDCITLNHRTCKIDYIPDKCAGIGDSVEYGETIRELDKKMEDIDALIKKVTLRDKEIDSSYDHFMEEITKFRKEINDCLDQLQNKIQIDAEKIKSIDKETVKKVLGTCSAVSSDIKKLKLSLQDKQSSEQNSQLYIMVKQAKSKLKLDDVKKAQEFLEKSNIQYTFERSTELENFLTKQDIFGKLLAFDTLTHREDINVETKSDKVKCWITGCAAVSTNKLVLADKNNNKLKVVDTQSKVVTEEKSLNSAPHGIAVLPHDQIAVTMPKKQTILIISTAGKLSISSKIPVKATCFGITYRQGQLYIVCQDPLSVIILDTQGNINNTIFLDKKIFAKPRFILLSQDGKHIYISNCDSGSLVSVTLHGDVSAVYKHKDLIGPTGMMALEDGSLLVCCCCLNATVHRISGDLKQGQTILDRLHSLWCICYNHHQQEVYIGTLCDQLKVMKITWK